MKIELIKTASLAALLLTGLALPVQANSCRAYTTRDGREVNNCPVLEGIFSNSDWQVDIGKLKEAAYYYRGENRNNGQSLQLTGFNVQGTTQRTSYKFYNGGTAYIVTFRPSDPNTIRLEVHQSGKILLNQLLYRSGQSQNITSGTNKNCNRAIVKAKQRMQRVGARVVSARTNDHERYGLQGGPRQRPLMYSFGLSGRGASNLLNSPALLTSISTQIISNCSKISAINFGLDQTEWIETFGLMNNGKVQKFKCLKPLASPSRWGEVTCL